MEEWKPIVSHPNYSISNLGNVKNMTTGRMLKNKDNGIGYVIVSLSKNNSSNNFLVSRLVGEYFLEGFDPKLEIDHIDRNKQNNNMSNLRCVSRSDNLRNKSKRTGCSSKYKGVYQLKNGKWRSSGYNDGIVKYLGQFETEEDAYQKYLEYNTENGFLV